MCDELRRSTSDDLKEREKCPTLIAIRPPTKPTVSVTGMSTISGDELSLRHLQQEPRRRCISTRTSTTVDELHKQGHRPPWQHCNCGNSTVFCTVGTQAPVLVQQRASQPCPRTTPVGSCRSSAQYALWEHASSKRSNRRPAQQRHRSPGQSTATADTTVFCSVNPKHQSLDATGMSTTVSKTANTSLREHRDVHPVDELHEGNIDHPDMHNNGHVNNCVQELDTQSPRRRRGSPRSIAILISSPRGWARLGRQFRPRVRAQLRIFSNGEKCEKPCKILICIVTQTPR